MAKKAKAGENKASTFMIVTQLKEEYFNGWSEDERAAIGDLQGLMAVVARRLEDAGAQVTALYAIVHDHDRAADGSLVPEHVHIVGRFGDRKSGLTPTALGEAVGIGPMTETPFEKGRFERGTGPLLVKADQGKYSFDNMLAYLIHAKDDEKHPYGPEKVETFAGCGCKDYVDIEREKHDAWDVGRAVKNSYKAKSKERVSVLEQKILDGEVRRQDLLLDGAAYEVYSRNARKLDDALRVADARRMARAAVALRRGEFCKTTVFVNGASGSGKTVFLRGLCSFMESKMSWHVSELAARNALDDYDGSEVVFMDDVREGAMSAEDWLRFIDPYNASRGSARYHNTESVAPRVIIISSNKDPHGFFSNSRGITASDKEEAIDTFIRRITVQVEMSHPSADRSNNWSNIKLLEPGRIDEMGSDEGQPATTGREWCLRVVDGGDGCSPYVAASYLIDKVYARNVVWAAGTKYSLEEAKAELNQLLHERYMPAGQSLDGLPEISLPQEQGHAD